MPEDLSVAQAAQLLGVSVRSVRLMAGAGRFGTSGIIASAGPMRLRYNHVQDLAARRRGEAREALRRKGTDLVDFARQTLDTIWPNTSGMSAEYAATAQVGLDALPALHPDAMPYFGPATLRTCAKRTELRSAAACLYCFADHTAAVYGQLHPENSPAFAVLLGQPCAADHARWADVQAKGAALMADWSRQKAADAERSQLRAEHRLKAAEVAFERAAEELVRARASARKGAPTGTRSVRASGQTGTDCVKLLEQARSARSRGDTAGAERLYAQIASLLGLPQ